MASMVSRTMRKRKMALFSVRIWFMEHFTDIAGPNLPKEETKRDSGLQRSTPAISVTPGHTNEDSQGDGAGEPEDHRDSLQSQSSELVEDAGEVEGCDADVC